MSETEVHLTLFDVKGYTFGKHLSLRAFKEYIVLQVSDEEARVYVDANELLRSIRFLRQGQK